ncbi:hypothetical protein A2Z00_03135 [Candidatus Gottesmanbacteria bacterium RBG_13_45_10]|uniref:Inosine/uridine-preferring nucleoside hydrolase domain-containing protein n=1 Tax=Candidatus Gottesmanbacteria bacterium RBG_13_45_10 TaxID=1798370 RepID=A0A1F5ZGD8_9BACT|nr:MAG: hypothetical protein A2Z00_03135 [Candidatus Gottesmanbacteria bacterium RBG_13_45_10]
MKKTPLYIDTDMGVDDIVAISMIVASNKFDIRGVSVVNGVTTTKRSIRNAQKILGALNMFCPIFIGANQAQQGSTKQFPAIDRRRAMGLSLLKNISLPPSGTNPIAEISQLPEKITREINPITLLCIGPLTNVSTLLACQTAQRTIRRLYVMGGAIDCPGNVAPQFFSEYNVRLDPVAARSVFNTQLPIVLTPMDATREVPAKIRCATSNQKSNLATFYDQLKIIKPKSVAGRIMKAILLNNQSDFLYFYDPLVAAILIDRSIIRRKEMRSLSVKQTGRLIGNVISSKNAQTKTTVVFSVDAKKFYAQLIHLIREK